MRYLFTVVSCVWFSTVLCAESKDSSTSETGKEECVFEVRPEHGADKDQLALDLDAKLAEFDDCLNREGAGTQGQGGKQGGSSTKGLSAAAGSGSGDATQGEDGSADPSDQQSNEEEQGDSVEDQLNLIDNLSSRKDKQAPIEPNDRRDDTKTVQNRLREDDVAKLLREAAEKETDPTRKASLYKNYEDYMAGRKK